jgi:hypothetical protein
MMLNPALQILRSELQRLDKRYPHQEMPVTVVAAMQLAYVNAEQGYERVTVSPSHGCAKIPST